MVSSKATTVADYLAREQMVYGMIGWVIPLETYPDTYNGQPLAYVALAAQKNAYSLYLTCVYVSPDRTERLKAAYVEAGKKLDMGKTCLRFKRVGQLVDDALAIEIGSATPTQLIAITEEARSGSC